MINIGTALLPLALLFTFVPPLPHNVRVHVSFATVCVFLSIELIRRGTPHYLNVTTIHVHLLQHPLLICTFHTVGGGGRLLATTRATKGVLKNRHNNW